VDGEVFYGSEATYQAGNCIQITAGENITSGNVVYVLKSDGKAYVSDTTTTADYEAIGIALQTVLTGNSVVIQTSGKWITAGLTANSTYYLGVAGAISLVGSHVKIGYALSTTVLMINIEKKEIELIDVQTLAVAGTTFTFDNLDINSIGSYYIEAKLQSGTVTECTVRLRINNDTTPTNYDSQLLWVSYSNVIPYSCNENLLTQVQGNGGEVTLKMEIYRTISGYVVARATTIGYYSLSEFAISIANVRTRGTVANLTRIDIVSDNNFSVGSSLKLYKRL